MPGDDGAEVGPFEVSTKLSSLVIRAEHCPHFSAGRNCLRIASLKNWENFTCSGCKFLNSTDCFSVDAEIDADIDDRVPIKVFLARIYNNSEKRGYSPGNFQRKIATEIATYYGRESNEFLYIRLQLAILNAIIEQNTNIDELAERSFQISEKLGKNVPQLHKLYVRICGARWI